MSKLSIRFPRTLAVAAGIAALAAGAEAQGLLSTQGVLVATDGDPAPDSAGLPIPGVTFGGAGALGDGCVLDESGRVLFRARLTGGTQTATTERAYFYGASRADLRLVVRGGDQAPGMPAGIVLGTAGGAISPLSSAVRLSPDGRMWWGSYLNDPVNGTLDSSNNEGVFGGFLGSQTLFVRKGDPAPGTLGATFVQAFSSPGQQYTGINREGRIYFQGTLTGGDVNGTLNQAGIWSGMPGALELVARRGTLAPGLSGEEVATTGLALGPISQMNESGQYLYQLTLSTTSGSPVATPADDTVLMVHTPGAGSAPLLREGDAAPGTFNGTSSATFNALTGEAWAPSTGPCCWTRTGQTLFATDLRGGDVVTGVNDRAIYRARLGAIEMVTRRGATAPGTDARFDAWNASSLCLSASGLVCFQATLTGGTSSTANDTGLWTGAPGSLQRVLREGDPMPGTGGSVAGHVSGSLVFFNDLGQLLFNVTLAGGTVTGNSLWAWDPALGLVAVILPGDQIQVGPATFKTITSFGSVGWNNTDGAALHFGHDGRIAQRVGFSDGTGAILTVRVPAPAATVTPYCFGDGSGTACPCGNAGAPGNGCANSIHASGAHLAASGVARISSDSFRLSGSGMPNSSALYFQGTVQQNGGLGVVFGDGLRCAGGTVVRLGTKANQAGASRYPDTGDQPVSVRGLVTSAGTRTYQIWYRNAAAYCTASTFNLSNGLQATWIP
jgi:hypothetical protein